MRATCGAEQPDDAIYLVPASTTMATIDLAAYQSKRATLISEDRALRRDYGGPPRSELEANADGILRRLRDAEASSIWKSDHESVLHPFPGMEFLTGKSWVIFYLKP